MSYAPEFQTQKKDMHTRSGKQEKPNLLHLIKAAYKNVNKYYKVDESRHNS